MLATLTTIREYLKARLRVDIRSEAGQSVVEYLVLIVGAVIAGWLFPRLGIGLPAGLIGQILSAAIGAVILLVIIGLVRRA